MKKSSTSKAKQIQQKNAERESENNYAASVFESLTNSAASVNNDATIIDIVTEEKEQEEEKVENVMEGNATDDVQQHQPQYAEGEIIVEGEEEEGLSSSAGVGAVGSNRKRKQNPVVLDKKSSSSSSSSLSPRSNKRGTSTNTKKYVRTDRDINFAALLEYANQHGHCNIAVNETFECDLPPTIGAYGQEDSPFHYQGPLGYWLHEELGRLRRKKGNKAARERQSFQDLVDQGKLNQFPVDPEVLVPPPPPAPKPVLDPSVPREKRATVHIEWNLCYNALLDYKSKHGHCNVHQKDFYECVLPGFGEDGGDYVYRGRLGRWLDNQRQFKKNGRLSADKYALLQEQAEQGVLYWDGSDMSHAGLSRTHEGVDWNKHFAALLEYGKVFNTCNVPQKYTFECDISVNAIIGAGTGIRRINASAAEIINNSIPVVASVGSSSEDATGSSSTGSVTAGDGSKVIADIDIDDSVYHYKGRLGRWLDNQRQFKKGNGGKLYPERDSKLQALVDEGKLAWHSQGTSSAQQKRAVSEEEWPKHFAALLEYLRENPTRGSCISQTLRYSCDIQDPGSEGAMIRYNGKLGRWCAAQRKIKREKDRHSSSGNSSATVAATNMYILHPDREALMQQLVDEGKFSWVVRSTSIGSHLLLNHGATSGNSAMNNGDATGSIMMDHIDLLQHNLLSPSVAAAVGVVDTNPTRISDAEVAAAGVIATGAVEVHDNHNLNHHHHMMLNIASDNNAADADAMAIDAVEQFLPAVYSNSTHNNNSETHDNNMLMMASYNDDKNADIVEHQQHSHVTPHIGNEQQM